MIRRPIETDEMPIGRISVHACKAPNMRHTLCAWWATRPLAASRAGAFGCDPACLGRP